MLRMSEAKAYAILGEMNKLLNKLGDEAAIKPMEEYLDTLVVSGFIRRWERNLYGRAQAGGGGYIIYTSGICDGININWNDTKTPFSKPNEEGIAGLGQKVN